MEPRRGEPPEPLWDSSSLWKERGPHPSNPPGNEPGLREDMDITFIGIGMVLGFAVALPIGSVSALCLQWTCTIGPRAGLCVGTGSAIADATYGWLGLAHYEWVLQQVVPHAGIITKVVGLLLLAWGASLFRQKQLEPPHERQLSSSRLKRFKPWSAVIAGFALTVVNPGNAFALLGGLQVFGVNPGEGRADLFFLGIIVGSLCWWALFSSLARRLVKGPLLRRMNILIGSLLILSGCSLFLSHA
jgi:putative LysE/RhtB family amino acid efflux pump